VVVSGGLAEPDQGRGEHLGRHAHHAILPDTGRQGQNRGVRRRHQQEPRRPERCVGARRVLKVRAARSARRAEADVGRCSLLGRRVQSRLARLQGALRRLPRRLRPCRALLPHRYTFGLCRPDMLTRVFDRLSLSLSLSRSLARSVGSLPLVHELQQAGFDLQVIVSGKKTSMLSLTVE
jgi:hypothetical protein